MSYPLIKRGSRGQYVKLAQQKLGINADGIFGAQTEQAVRDFQRRKGLTVDGIVGSNTWKALMGTQTNTPAPTAPTGGSNSPVIPAPTQFTVGGFLNAGIGAVLLYGLFKTIQKVF